MFLCSFSVQNRDMAYLSSIHAWKGFLPSPSPFLIRYHLTKEWKSKKHWQCQPFLVWREQGNEGRCAPTVLTSLCSDLKFATIFLMCVTWSVLIQAHFSYQVSWTVFTARIPVYEFGLTEVLGIYLISFRGGQVEIASFLKGVNADMKMSAL